MTDKFAFVPRSRNNPNSEFIHRRFLKVGGAVTRRHSVRKPSGVDVLPAQQTATLDASIGQVSGRCLKARSPPEVDLRYF